MKKPEHIINTPPSDNESWGSYDSETKQWSERVYSGKAIREWIQTNISNLKRASSTLNTLLSKLFGDNFINLINSYTKAPITNRLDEVDNIFNNVQDIIPDPDKYYITQYKKLTFGNSEINLEVPVAKDYKILEYSLKIQQEIPSNWSLLKTTQTSNTITTILKDLQGVSNWYNQNNQYIILKHINGKNNITDYINVTDSLGGSLTDQFIISSINNNIVYIKWNGLSPLDNSDQGIKIIFKI